MATDGGTIPTRLDFLPPELLLNIFLEVATQADAVSNILNLTLVCRTFHSLLVPPNAATDRTVWKKAVQWIIGADDEVDIQLLQDPSYQSYFRRVAALHAPPAPESPHSLRVAKPDEKYFTRGIGGPFQPSPTEAPSSPANPPRTYEITTCPLPPLKPNTTRIYDFLHTPTDGGNPTEGYTSMSSTSHSNDFIFTDDPRQPWSYVLEGDPLVFGRGRLKSGGGYPLEIIPSGPERGAFASIPHFHAWARQSVSSDPDLILTPGEHFTDVLKVTNVNTGYSWDLSPLNLDQLNFDMDSIWEARSCGPYLAMVEKVPASLNTRPWMFCMHENGNFWQHCMPEPVKDEYLIITNSAFQMNTSYIAIASRSYDTIRGSKAQMNIYLYSTATGKLFRTLTLPQECGRAHSELGARDAWCSIAISESHVVATVGGYSTRDRESSWQFNELFFWDLRPSAPNTPAFTTQLPSIWNLQTRTLVGFSQTGTQAFVTHRWEIALFDIPQKSLVGVWKVPAGAAYDHEDLEEPDDLGDQRYRDTWWNGLWIGYHDVDEHQKTIASGVAYFVSSVFREFFDDVDDSFTSDPEAADREDFPDEEMPKWRIRDGVWIADTEGCGEWRSYHRGGIEVDVDREEWEDMSDDGGWGGVGALNAAAYNAVGGMVLEAMGMDMDFMDPLGLQGGYGGYGLFNDLESDEEDDEDMDTESDSDTSSSESESESESGSGSGGDSDGSDDLDLD